MEKINTVYWNDGRKSFVVEQASQCNVVFNPEVHFAVIQRYDDNFYYNSKQGWLRRKDDLVTSETDYNGTKEQFKEFVQNNLKKYLSISVELSNQRRVLIELTSWHHFKICTTIAVHVLEYDGVHWSDVSNINEVFYSVIDTQHFDPVNDIDIAIEYMLDLINGNEIFIKPGRHFIDLYDPTEGTKAYMEMS